MITVIAESVQVINHESVDDFIGAGPVRSSVVTQFTSGSSTSRKLCDSDSRNRLLNSPNSSTGSK